MADRIGDDCLVEIKVDIGGVFNDGANGVVRKLANRELHKAVGCLEVDGTVWQHDIVEVEEQLAIFFQFHAIGVAGRAGYEAADIEMLADLVFDAYSESRIGACILETNEVL